MPSYRAAAFVRGLFLVLLCCLAVAPASSIAAPSLISSFGTTDADTSISAMTRDADGNLYVAGTFGGATLSIGGQMLGRSQAPLDIFIAKFRPDGQATWAQSIGSGVDTLDPTVAAIALDSAGKVYLVGSFSGNFTALSADAQNDRYGFVLQTTEGNGSVDWSRVFAGPLIEALDVAIDSDQNAVFVAGRFSGGPVNTPSISLTGDRDGFVARLRADTGDAVWGAAVGGLGTTAELRSIALDANQRTIYLSGDFRGADLTRPPVSIRGGTDAGIFRLDYDGGNLGVVQSFSGPGANITPARLTADSAANLYLVGNFGEGRITSPAAAALSGAGGEVTGFAVKLATDGTVAWANRFGGQLTDVNFRAAALSGSRLYIGGSFDGDAVTTPAGAAMTRIGSTDGFVIALAPDGQVASASNYGGPGARLSIQNLAVNAQGNVVLGGQFSNASLTIPAASLIGTSSGVMLADAAPRPTLTVSAPSNGSVRDGGGDLVCGTSCSASYPVGSTVTLTATPATGYGFAGWGGDCSGTDNPLTFTLNAAKACSASFAASNAGGGGNNTPAPSVPSVPATPPAFVTTPVPVTLDAATVGTGTGSVSFASAFANPAALAFSVASASTTPLPAWLSFDPASVSFSYNVPLPSDLPIQPIADGDADTPSRTGRADARAAWANTLYPPLIRVAQIPVTLTATGAGQSYASTIRMSFYAPRPRVAVAAISLSQDGALGNARAGRSALSFDAGQAVFQTAATNLFPAAPNADTDIVRYHALSGTRDRLSQTAIPGGGVANAANGPALNPAVSPDGRFAAFAADATGITLTPSGRVRQVYRTSLAHPRVDLDAARTPAPDFVSATADGIPGNAPSDKPALSEDGRYVVFESTATNFAQGLDGTRQVWRKDLATGALALVSAAAAPANGPSGNPAVSWDGRFVAFDSTATNLTANPGNATQVYLKDMTSGAIRLISASAGTPANAAATTPVIAARADRIAFVSAATNLGIPNQAGRNQVVIADSASGRLDLVAADADQPAISADGRFVAFRAAANGVPQIWVRDTARAVTALVTQTADGNPGNGPSWAPAIAGDGTTIAFASDARDLVNGNPAPGQAYLAANPLVLPEKTGYWYMPAIGGGQGWVMERWADRAYVAGLAYDTNGRSQWLAGFCNLSGLTCSGRLNHGPVFTLETAPAGTAATLTVGATVPQTLSPYPIGGRATTGLAGLPQAGWWYEPDAANDVGYFLAFNTQAQTNGATAHVGYLAVLGYDASRQPVWQTAQATLAADLSFSATLTQYAGGMPFGGGNQASPAAIPAGQVRIVFTANDRARIALPDGRIVSLERFRF